MNIMREYINKIRSSKTSKIWLVSYILILFMPILFSFVSYYYVENRLSDKINEINTNTLKSSQNFMDNILGAIITATASLSSSEEISELARQATPPSVQQRYELTRSNYVWSAHSVFETYITNKFIYFPDTDNIYTGKTITPSHYHYLSRYVNETEMTEEIWKNNVLLKSVPNFISVPSTSGTRVFYIFPTYKYNQKEVLFNTIVELDFTRLIADMPADKKGTFFMYSSDGTLLTTSDADSRYAQAVKSIYESDSIVNTYTSDTDSLIILKTMSSVSNWIYGSVVPEKEYWSDLSHARSIMLTLSIMCVLLGIMIIMYFMKRNNKPLENIIRTLSPNADESYPDAIEYINNLISKTLTEKGSYEGRLFKQNDKLKENILSNILHGVKNDKFTFEEQLTMVGIDMKDNLFSTVALYPEDLSDMFAGDDYNATENEKQKLAQFIISNILGEAINEKFTAETVSMSNFTVAIINFSDTDAPDFKETVNSILTDCFAIIEKEFGFKTIGAISNHHISLSHLNDAYNESVLAMEYAISAKCNILSYNDINSVSKFKKPYSMENEEQIIEALNEKDYKKSKKLIENQIYKFQLNKNASTEVARAFACDLLSTFFKHVISNNDDKSRQFIANVEMNSIMSEGNTVSNIMLRTITIIDTYLESFRDETEDDSNDRSNFYHRIKEYIDTNYSNPDLSVTELSAIFKTNSSYLSSQFKKEFDIGLLDYITTVRIDAAKKLLVTTDSPNTEISLQVGYSNTRTFLRAFSKAEGITPKEYRRINNPAI